MSLLKSQIPLNTHKNTLLPPCSFAQSGVPNIAQGKKIEVRGLASSRFFPVIGAQLTGLLRFPAPSAVSLQSPVLNPNPRGTFSWLTSTSPFTPFFPTMSLLRSSEQLKRAARLHVCYILLSCFLSPCG